MVPCIKSSQRVSIVGDLQFLVVLIAILGDLDLKGSDSDSGRLYIASIDGVLQREDLEKHAHCEGALK